MKRNLTPPQVAKLLGVSSAKVILWIRQGELRALNLANRGCNRPRYSISPEALEAFERSRQVIPDGGQSTTRKLRKNVVKGPKEFF